MRVVSQVKVVGDWEEVVLVDDEEEVTVDEEDEVVELVVGAVEDELDEVVGTCEVVDEGEEDVEIVD